MTPEQYEQARALFLDACDVAPHERDAFLTTRCDDPVVRARVASMLAADADSGVIDEPALGSDFSVATSAPGGPDPERIGSYRILERIGEGGMGRVYRGEQENPRREVAIKLLRPGMTSDSLLRRFEYEAQVLGRLEHPGVAQIFEAGTYADERGPRPFFAMEYIRGRTLLRYADDESLGLRARLDLLRQITDAVHHAHQCGVIHRDLKPDNIMVDERGRAKVLDFGVARVTEDDARMTIARTDVGQLVGTLAYMSPEQVSGRSEHIDTRSDVYAIGLIAYELLTGRAPYSVAEKSVPEAARIVTETEPAPVSAVDRRLRGDIATILRKALEKNPERRYQSVAALGADIERYLNDEPILARPPSAAYQLSKFARRNRGLVAGVGLAFVVLVAGLVGVSVALARTLEAERTAAAEATRANLEAAEAEAISDFIQEIFTAAQPIQGGQQDVRVRDVLDDAATRLETRFEDQPRVKGLLHYTLATTYRELNLAEPAIEQFEKSIAVRESIPDRTDEDRTALAVTKNGLAILYRRRGENARAAAMYRDVVASHLAVEGRGSEYASALHNLGNALVSVDLDEAEERLRESYELHRELMDETEMGRSIVTSSYAAVLDQRGRFADAELLHREAVRLMKTSLPEGHPAIANAQLNLAACLRAQEKFDEAEPVYLEAWERGRAAYGEGSLFDLFTAAEYAQLLARADRPDEAEAVYDRMIQPIEAEGEFVSPIAVRLRRDYAFLLTRQERFSAAEAVLLEVVRIADAASNGDQLTLDVTAGLLADLYEAWGRPEEAATWAARRTELTAPVDAEDAGDS